MTEPCVDCGAPVTATDEVAVQVEVDRALGEEVALICDSCWHERLCSDCREVES